jgi:hypothetical protein
MRTSLPTICSNFSMCELSQELLLDGVTLPFGMTQAPLPYVPEHPSALSGLLQRSAGCYRTCLLMLDGLISRRLVDGELERERGHGKFDPA